MQRVFMKLKGARIVIECLIEEGVDTVFGYPGGAILNIYEELYENSNRIRHILTAHEQGAAHAADGYARSTGRVGVVMATSGPGATNLVTGIATAYMDSIPMVAITCNVGTKLLGKDSFQEVDITGITMPITKHNFIVKNIAELSTTIREAFLIAKTGRPGPVLIDIPKDITDATYDYEPLKAGISKNDDVAIQKASLRRIMKVDEPTDDMLQIACDMINKSSKPFIYAGGGVQTADACMELLSLAERANIPVATSLMGKAAFPNLHPLFCGMIGMHGTKASNLAGAECDLLIAIGTRFSDRVIGEASKFAKEAKILHIDIDPAEVNKNIKASYSLIGNIKYVLSRLLPKINERQSSEWNTRITDWKKEVPKTYGRQDILTPQFLFEHAQSVLPGDSIIVTEVGQHQMWAAQFYNFTMPRTFLTSGGLGTMGFGTGAAIGAKIAFPNRCVVHFAGDGSFRMNCNELATISHYKLPIIIVIVNNGTLGMVRQWQTLFYQKHYSHTTLDFAPDFVKLAQAYGINGARATTRDEFLQAFDKALSSNAACVIDAVIDIDEMVLPMIPAGKPITSLIMDL